MAVMLTLFLKKQIWHNHWNRSFKFINRVKYFKDYGKDNWN